MTFREPSTPFPADSSGHAPADAVEAARNQALFRDINEHIAEVTRRMTAATETNPFLCECSRMDCVTYVSLTIDEYDNLRRRARRFVIAPSAEHFAADRETVVSMKKGFWIIEKTGVGAEIAEQALGNES